jgi:Alpha/beta hydrolase of unknown function (DUF1400)
MSKGMSFGSLASSLKGLRRGCTAAIAATTLALGCGLSASALETVQARYGPLGLSVEMDDLEAFVAGESTSNSFNATLRNITGYGGVSEDQLRTALTAEINVGSVVDPTKAVELMYGFVGERVLERIANIVFAPYTRGNYYALRGAIVLAMVDDGKISPIEVLQNYGPRTLRIDGAAIAAAYDEIKSLLEQLGQ